MSLHFLLKFTSLKFRTRKYLRALETGDLKSAEVILNLGINSQLALKPTLLLGSADLLQKLLFKGAHLRPIENESPLKFARLSAIDSEQKIRLILNSGTDVNGTVGKRRIALINWAILQHDKIFFKILMKAGADVQTPDRAGLSPLAAARMTEELEIEKEILSAGVRPEPYTEALLELLVINESLYLSELYQLIKWCVKNSGFVLQQVTYPHRQTVCFRISSKDLLLRIELKILPDQQITLVLFHEGERFPYLNLIPLVSQLDSKTLRGHLVTALKEIAQSETGRPKQARVDVSSEAHQSFQILGLSPDANEQEIISAYRSLAKQYHPDVALSVDPSKMAEINRAYERLRK